MVLDVVLNFLINKVLRKQETIGTQLHTTSTRPGQVD